MVARAVAQEPRVMVLDEITAFLDLPHRVEIMRLLADLAHRILTDDGRPVWRMTREGRTATHASLEALVAEMKPWLTGQM